MSKATLHLKMERVMSSSNGNGSKPVVDPNKPTIPLGHAFERTNKAGDRYIVLALGAAKLLLFETGRGDNGQFIWEAYMGEGRIEQVAALARRIGDEGKLTR